jgi:hypothetical protein
MLGKFFTSNPNMPSLKLLEQIILEKYVIIPPLSPEVDFKYNITREGLNLYGADHKNRPQL